VYWRRWYGVGGGFGLLALTLYLESNTKLSFQQTLFYGITVFVAVMNTLSDDEVSGKLSWIVGAVVAVVIGYSVPSISGSWWGILIGPILLCIAAGMSKLVYR